MSINSTAAVCALLARCLPHAAARRLGGVLGRAGAFPGDGRRRAVDRLRAAFPELDQARLTSLARAAAAERAAAAVDDAVACRLAPRALCRRLTLGGWGRLVAAEERRRGVVVLGAGFGCWQLAALAVALYRGPLDVPGDWRDDPVFRRLAAGLERRSGTRLIRNAAEGPDATPAEGVRVGFLADRYTESGDAVDLPFLGRTLAAGTAVARASIASGAPAVPVFARPRPGGWLVEVRSGIEPEGDAPTLTARYLDAIEAEVRRRPERWRGWWG